MIVVTTDGRIIKSGTDEVVDYKEVGTERVWVEPTYGVDAEGKQTEMITEGHYEELPVYGYVVRKATAEEFESNEVPMSIPKTDTERIEKLEEQNEMLTECILELSEYIYA